MPQSPGVVAVLHERLAADARPDEQDALVQVDAVTAALTALGWRVERVAADADLEGLVGRLQALAPRIVFNLVESLAGTGALIATVPALLRSAGFGVTGCDANALFLTSHKILAKRWLRLHGVPTPDWFTAGDDLALAGGRWIVKSVWEHASFGLDDGCVVAGVNAVADRLAASRERHGGEWFAERFVAGREFNISLIERYGRPCVLPLAEIEFGRLAAGRPQIVGYAAKWLPETPEYHATERVFPELPAALQNRLRRLAENCWDIFGLSGAARVDVRLDSDQAPWVLEVNANPCLSPDAGFFASAERAGFSYASMIGLIVAAATRDTI